MTSLVTLSVWVRSRWWGIFDFSHLL